MKEKLLIIITLLLTFYGVTGFWANIGNQTINIALFLTIIIALILAPLAVIISTYCLTKYADKGKILLSGVLNLIISAIDFVILSIWFNRGADICTGFSYAIISGMIISLGSLLLISSITLFIIAVKNHTSKKLTLK